MNNRIDFKLNSETIENLQTFSELLKKDINTILDEALEQYFASEQKKLLDKNLDDENALTNLDYNEFWDGVDI
jgi:tRNA A37 N6-isopentenylltransferase MiaA